MKKEYLEVPTWLKKIKCFSITKSKYWGTNYRFNWGEFSNNGGFSLTFEPWHYFDDRPMIHIQLPFHFNLFLYLPIHTGKDECETPIYGIKYHDQALWIHIHRKHWAWYMPWSWQFYKRWERVKDWRKEVWVELPKGLSHGKVGGKETHDYTYVLNSGEVQKRKATIYAERMEWRWRWFMWLPFPRKQRDCISVEFSGEVGEETGSWKGGTLGCGYEMKNDETMIGCLRRMEKERKF